MDKFKPAWWAKNRHLQTILPVLLPFPLPQYTRERWITPDDDFIDLDWINKDKAHLPNQPLLIIFHGLESNSSSHYCRSMMAYAEHKNWSATVVHFRSCSGELNLKPTFYYPGSSQEIDWILKRFAQQYSNCKRYAVGFSLGGSILIKWLGESGAEASHIIEKAASVCAPHDLKAGAIELAKGFNQKIYMRNFLISMKKKGFEVLKRHPGVLPITVEQIKASKNFFDVDKNFTAPANGYKNAEELWQKCSAKQFMKHIAIPTLIINAKDDPFVPAKTLAQPTDVSPSITCCYTSTGGHLGFVTKHSTNMLHASWMPDKILMFLEKNAP